MSILFEFVQINEVYLYIFNYVNLIKQIKNLFEAILIIITIKINQLFYVYL